MYSKGKGVIPVRPTIPEAGCKQRPENRLLVVAAEGFQLGGSAVFDPFVADSEACHRDIVAVRGKEDGNGLTHPRRQPSATVMTRRKRRPTSSSSVSSRGF